MTGQRYTGSKIQKLLNLTLTVVAYKPLPQSWFNSVYKKRKGMVNICCGNNEWPWWNGYQRSCILLTSKTSVFNYGAFIQELMNKFSWYLSTIANSCDSHRFSLSVSPVTLAPGMLPMPASLQSVPQAVYVHVSLLTWSYYYYISVTMPGQAIVNLSQINLKTEIRAGHGSGITYLQKN